MLGPAIVLLTVLSGGVGISLAYLAWKRRDVPGARTFAVYMTCHGIWALSYGVVLASSSRSGMYTAYLVVVSAALATPFAWLWFVLEYTGRSEWVRPRRAAAFWTIPVLHILLYPTSSIHGLVMTDAAVGEAFGLTFIVHTGGPLLVGQLVLIYLVILIAYWLLLVFLFRERNLYRKQTGAILGASVVVVVTNIAWLAATGWESTIDPTPILYGVSGIVIWWALFEFDFLDVSPLAADTLIEAMEDPILVIGDDRVLLDYNQRASDVFGLEESMLNEPIIGRLRAIVTAPSEQPIRVQSSDDSSDVSNTAASSESVYQPRRTQLCDHHDIARGELIVFREITLQKRREETLETIQAGTRDLMDAETKADVASVATEKAAAVFEQPFVGVLRYDDDRDALVSATITEPTSSLLDGDEMVIDGGVVWETFQNGTSRLLDRSTLEGGQYAHLPLEHVLVYPLGDHGVFAVGTDTDAPFTTDEIRFAEILALAAAASLDRAEREERLETQRAALEERNDALDEFASMVSHDLRNPLSTAMGYLELARDEPTADHFDAIEVSHDRLDRIIEDILALARHGDSAVDPAPVSIGETARTAWETAGPDRGSLVVSDGIVIRADEERLVTVFENLFRNAREHGNETVTVTVDIDPEAGTLVVEDDGPGLDPETHERLFEYGYTTETNGTGFGLSIVETIASAHDWTVSAGTGSDGGAQFTFGNVVIEAVPPTGEAE